MSRAKPKFIWIVLANSQPVAAFPAEEPADSLCMELNNEDRTRARERAQAGLATPRTYYTWVKLEVGAGTKV